MGEGVWFSGAGPEDGGDVDGPLARFVRAGSLQCSDKRLGELFSESIAYGVICGGKVVMGCNSFRMTSVS